MRLEGQKSYSNHLKKWSSENFSDMPDQKKKKKKSGPHAEEGINTHGDNLQQPILWAFILCDKDQQRTRNCPRGFCVAQSYLWYNLPTFLSPN